MRHFWCGLNSLYVTKESREKGLEPATAFLLMGDCPTECILKRGWGTKSKVASACHISYTPNVKLLCFASPYFDFSGFLQEGTFITINNS